MSNIEQLTTEIEKLSSAAKQEMVKILFEKMNNEEIMQLLEKLKDNMEWHNKWLRIQHLSWQAYSFIEIAFSILNYFAFLIYRTGTRGQVHCPCLKTLSKDSLVQLNTIQHLRKLGNYFFPCLFFLWDRRL